jgi:hypothetical protein
VDPAIRKHVIERVELGKEDLRTMILLQQPANSILNSVGRAPLAQD